MGHIMLIIQVILSTVLPVWICLWLSRQVKRQLSSKSKLADSIPDTHFLLKRWWAELCISRKTRTSPSKYEEVYRSIKYIQPHSEKPRTIKTEDSCNSMLFYGADQNGNSLFIKFAIRSRRFVEISLQLATADKGIYVLPDYPNTIVPGNPNDKWSAAGLKIEQLQAQVRWRITYNGLLRNIAKETSSNDDNIDHVRLSCIFISNSRPLDWPADWSPKLHADAIAHEPWRSPQWINKIKLLDYTGLDQFGSIFGQVTFKDAPVSNLYLRGLRQPRWGKHESHQFHRAVVFYGVTASGIIFYMGAGSTKHSFKRLQFGQLKHSNETLRKVEKVDFELSDFNEKRCANSERDFKIIADGFEYNIHAKLGSASTFLSGNNSNWATRIINMNLQMNGYSGVGLMQLWYPYDGPVQVKIQLPKLVYVKPNVTVRKTDYITFFNEEKCQNESLVGGKGFSLGVLASMKTPSFIVPEGFCVTAVAFDLQIKSQEKISKIINELADISTGKKNGDLEKICEIAIEIISSTAVVESIREAILKSVERLESSLEDKSECCRYAVRSSALGEDSEETSAAGQNSTYLGIAGAESVVKHVAMCWASLYSYQSVQYRRQHGLAVKASMGVCVQRMVPAEAAGVMFTRHPTTGDPSEILITANYGLGESVVSAMVEPDTITVYRSWDNELSIKSSVLGKKTEKILMNDDGVTSSSLNEHEAQQVSISEKTALELASIGLDLETLFGSARDIEWAVSKDKIFLLQARPITTLNTWSDFELTHELDSAVPSDIDLTTFANVGEVFPEPVSPLTASVVIKDINQAIAHQQNDYDPCYLSTTSMRCTINYYNSMLKVVEKDISLIKKAADIAVGGDVIINEEIHRIACERNGVSTPTQMLYLSCNLARDAWQNGSIEKMTREFRKRYTLNTDDYHTASSLFAKINSKLDDFHQISLYHGHTSSVSVTFQMIAMSLLMKGYDDFIPDHFRDISTLLSSCSDVVSTEVPIILGQISKCIKENGKVEEFCKVNPKDAIPWLRKHCPPAAAKTEALFKEHGHRGIQELDFISEPWIFKPETLIETIQAICASSEEPIESKYLSVEETIASLRSPKSKISKLILKKLVPFCRKAVARRELTKAELIRVIHSLRLAYRKLAKFMVQESYLPSPDLIFFLTHQEIGDLIHTHNPTLIQKAYRRSRLRPQLMKLQYPELNKGVVLPLKTSHDVTIRNECEKLQGTSVCGGSILGRACVITDLSQAKEIKSGDILITHATDIGWSPYFPLLSGIVTELGGLISHGAVVAREYGLPCIVGAKGATQIFQTGDTVLLTADAGVLQMIERA